MNITLVWPDYFERTPDEKLSDVTRLTTELGQGLMTHELALERIARIEGIDDVPAFQKSLAEFDQAHREGAAQALNPPPPEEKKPNG